MVRRLRQLLLVLIAFAFIGGTSSQLARSAEFAAAIALSGMPCDMMAMMPEAGGPPGEPPGEPGAPCKGMMPDCAKQMCGVTDAALPVRLMATVAAPQSDDVKYWPSWSALADFVGEPEPLPPRTA